MKNTVKFWDRVSSPASAEPGGTSGKIITACSPFLKADQQVLDMGCGSGGITNALAPKVKQMVGIDISPKMLHFARQQAQEKQLDNVHYREGHLSNTDLSPGSFDVLMAFNVLHYVDALEITLQHVHQLLKPGGMFISSTACLRDKRNLMYPLLSLLKNIGILPPTHFYSSTALVAAIESAGFAIEKSFAITELPERFIVARKDYIHPKI